MLSITNNLLEGQNLQNVLNICNNFDNEEMETPNIGMVEKKGGTNFYRRVFVKHELLNEYYKNLEKFLLENIDTKKFDIVNLSKPNTWINQVLVDSNKNDSFHHDISYLTAITYLNEDFLGGEFEYIKDEKEYRINPKFNQTLIMDETLMHRVRNVEQGIRYSLITFYQFIAKEKKTLL